MTASVADVEEALAAVLAQVRDLAAAEQREVLRRALEVLEDDGSRAEAKALIGSAIIVVTEGIRHGLERDNVAIDDGEIAGEGEPCSVAAARIVAARRRWASERARNIAAGLTMIFTPQLLR